jgi:hypothetical protein
MTRCCSWCGLDMGRKIPFEDPSITHGICLVCSSKMLGLARLHDTMLNELPGSFMEVDSHIIGLADGVHSESI